MGVSFWDYLMDRTTKKYSIPSLDQLVLVAQNKNFTGVIEKLHKVCLTT